VSKVLRVLIRPCPKLDIIQFLYNILVLLLGDTKMAKQVTITAKIPAELKEKLVKSKVNVSAIVRKALSLEAERLEKERLRRLVEETSEIFQKIPTDEFVEAVRAGREAR
jgi:post-segregation antitoxin (ccd killing protein)